MLRRIAITTTAVSALALLAWIGGCAYDDTLNTFTTPADAAPAPTFTPHTDGGEDTVDADVLMCVSYDCPVPYTTCPNRLGLCATNLDSDVANCGECGHSCTYGDAGINPDQRRACISGKCHVFCESPSKDCNGLPEDGCEVNVHTDTSNCGECGVTCDAGSVCYMGSCGCPIGYTQCGSKCVPLDSDENNCGACGNTCNAPDDDAGAGAWPCGAGISPPNWGPVCENSKCAQNCKYGYANCNADLCGDGCETNLGNDTKNCGACGNECGPNQGCMYGLCVCGGNLALCPASKSICVDLMTDSHNCGGCGRECGGLSDGLHPEMGSPSCVLGKCSYYCPPGHADCNNRIQDGCEIDLTADNFNCGACGAHCDLDAGQPCANSQCLTKPCEGDAGGVF